MSKRTISLLLGATLAVFGIGTASAADYTFVVPVEVRELPPEFRFVDVRCNINFPGTPIGNTVRRELTGHAFVGEVRVEVNKRPGDARRPTSWDCSISLTTTAGVTHRAVLRPPAAPKFEPEIPARPGAPAVIYAKGDLR